MKIEKLSTDELKKRYILLCFSAMIYKNNTTEERRNLAKEIERREGEQNR